MEGTQPSCVPPVRQAYVYIQKGLVHSCEMKMVWISMTIPSQHSQSYVWNFCINLMLDR